MLALLIALSAHPLDPLSAKEIEIAAQVVKAAKEFPKGALFPSVELLEPAKADVLTERPTKREARVIVLDRAANATHEAVVDLAAKKLASWTPRPGVQPLVLLEEYEKVPKI